MDSISRHRKAKESANSLLRSLGSCSYGLNAQFAGPEKRLFMSDIET
jgi:hypothetical protein